MQTLVSQGKFYEGIMFKNKEIISSWRINICNSVDVVFVPDFFPQLPV